MLQIILHFNNFLILLMENKLLSNCKNNLQKSPLRRFTLGSEHLTESNELIMDERSKNKKILIIYVVMKKIKFGYDVSTFKYS